MADLSPTAYLILGMLRLGTQTGYDIKRIVDSSTRFFWAANYAQIYPELKQLKRRGLIAGSDQSTGGRKRIVYKLEPSGEAVLREWLTRDDELTLELRDLGLLKAFFADALDNRQRVDLVQRLRSRHERMLAKLKESEPGAEALAEVGNRFPLITLQSGVGYHEWAIGWCRQLEDELTLEIGG